MVTSIKHSISVLWHYNWSRRVVPHPAEQLFSASAWMDMYYGALTGTVKLNARPNYFNGHFGMTVQIPRKIPIIGGINLAELMLMLPLLTNTGS